MNNENEEPPWPVTSKPMQPVSELPMYDFEEALDACLTATGGSESQKAPAALPAKVAPADENVWLPFNFEDPWDFCSDSSRNNEEAALLRPPADQQPQVPSMTTHQTSLAPPFEQLPPQEALIEQNASMQPATTMMKGDDPMEFQLPYNFEDTFESLFSSIAASSSLPFPQNQQAASLFSSGSSQPSALAFSMAQQQLAAQLRNFSAPQAPAPSPQAPFSLPMASLNTLLSSQLHQSHPPPAFGSLPLPFSMAQLSALLAAPQPPSNFSSAPQLPIGLTLTQPLTLPPSLTMPQTSSFALPSYNLPQTLVPQNAAPSHHQMLSSLFNTNPPPQRHNTCHSCGVSRLGTGQTTQDCSSAQCTARMSSQSTSGLISIPYDFEDALNAWLATRGFALTPSATPQIPAAKTAMVDSGTNTSPQNPSTPPQPVNPSSPQPPTAPSTPAPFVFMGSAVNPISRQPISEESNVPFNFEDPWDFFWDPQQQPPKDTSAASTVPAPISVPIVNSNSSTNSTIGMGTLTSAEEPSSTDSESMGSNLYSEQTLTPTKKSSRSSTRVIGIDTVMSPRRSLSSPHESKPRKRSVPVTVRSSTGFDARFAYLKLRDSPIPANAFQVHIYRDFTSDPAPAVNVLSSDMGDGPKTEEPIGDQPSRPVIFVNTSKKHALKINSDAWEMFYPVLVRHPSGDLLEGDLMPLITVTKVRLHPRQKKVRMEAAPKGERSRDPETDSPCLLCSDIVFRYKGGFGRHLYDIILIGRSVGGLGETEENLSIIGRIGPVRCVPREEMIPGYVKPPPDAPRDRPKKRFKQTK